MATGAELKHGHIGYKFDYIFFGNTRFRHFLPPVSLAKSSIDDFSK
jgi:hypothetical protein